MMSTKKFIALAAVLVLFATIVYGVHSARNMMEHMKAQEVKIEMTEKELKTKNQKLEGVEKDNQGKQEKIQQLEEEKKNLETELHAKKEEEKRLAYARVLEEQKQASLMSQLPRGSSVQLATSYTGNGMWCTDYVHSKRPDIPIYGNAGYNWLSAAQAQGKATGNAPQPGAVAVMAGHVAYVEGVNPDGSYTVSEMGWNYQPGNFNRRTVSPGSFGGFIY